MMPALVAIAGDVIVGDCDRAALDRALPMRRPSLQRLRQTEVEHLHRAVLRQLDVGGLQIAVDDAALVRGLERRGDLTRDRQRFVERNRALRDAVRQRRAVDQFEHQRALRQPCFLEPVDLRDVRMIERREHLRLALESRDAIGIGGEEFGQNLDRDVAVQPRIARPIHLAHAACAEGGNDLVRAESRAAVRDIAMGGSGRL